MEACQRGSEGKRQHDVESHPDDWHKNQEREGWVDGDVLSPDGSSNDL